jgi:hypothetical protein
MARSKSRSNYGWVYSPKKEPSPKILEALKKLVQERFQEIIDNDLKPNCIHPPSPDSKLMYLVDIFGKWYRNYFYICGTYKYKNPLPDEDSSSGTSSLDLSMWAAIALMLRTCGTQKSFGNLCKMSP